ncbi:phosphoketolase family protein [Pedobacter paludis]|uniref:hypothetical protein n=1 Tax=Pedobacter paludis TaxID=2203212 RepID=UPI0021CE2B86|nr:hypothetical protein [Pedobacter paludis]
MLSDELLQKMDAYWRAANYLSVGQIYLYDSPLLKEPLQLYHVKPMLVGHWGTSRGQNFLYVSNSCKDQQLSAIVIMNNPKLVFEECFKLQ